MPELKCTVQTCVHNQQFLCDLDQIRVGGSDARNPQETCCDSFQERKDGSYSNSVSQDARHQNVPLLTAKQKTVCTMNSANATQARSA